jgi:diguanylate cyclase (GGDEF)-like protein
LPPLAQHALATGMVALVFVLDVLTGPEIALSILYMAPVAMIAWHRTWGSARVFVLLSGLAWLAADVLAGREYSFDAIRYWNALVRTAFFFIVAFTIVQLRRAVREEQRLARTDSLTGVANARWFIEQTKREIARQKRYLHPLSMAFLDCDNFKSVNDQHGHAAGDELLKRVSMAVYNSTREVDVVARMGGDEFAILLPESDARGAHAVCSKVRDTLNTSVREFNVTFSIGLVTYLRPAENVDELLHTADQAMYEAKNSGKNATRHRVIGEELASGTNA